MPTEEDIKAAFRDLASQAPDTGTVLAEVRNQRASRGHPGVRPLFGAARAGSPRMTRRPGVPRLAAALAAAAAVIAVAGTSVAVWGGGQAGRPARASGNCASVTDSGEGQAQHPVDGSSLLDRVPQYYMALIAERNSTRYEAVVRDTVTGATLACVRPPSRSVRFSMVAGAPDDRTFVLAASVLGKGDVKILRPSPPAVLDPTRLYLARFNPASGSIRLTALPIEFPAPTDVGGLALSPTGTELAVSTLSWNARSGKEYLPQIRIYSLASHGATSSPVKAWTGSGNHYMGTMSWARTGLLAFAWGTSSTGLGVRLLNTDAPGGSLVGDSRLALGFAGKGPGLPLPGYGWMLTADGTTIAAPKTGPLTSKVTVTKVNHHPKETVVSSSPGPVLEEFSAATGRLIGTIGPHWPAETFAATPAILWTNSSGSVLVALAPPIGGKSAQKEVLGVVSGSTFEPIPGAPGGYLAVNGLSPAF